jgi:disulfide bond formation protein DsbB
MSVTRGESAFRLARLLALLIPAGLLGGALISQYGFGLYPCEMCHWQRWPHYAALVPAIAAFLVRGRGRDTQRVLIAIAALLIAISGAIGILHAGVEYGWWEGLTRCSSPTGARTLDDIMNTPLIRCDVPQWTLFGLSLAGYNAIFSLGGALVTGWLLLRSKGRV